LIPLHVLWLFGRIDVVSGQAHGVALPKQWATGWRKNLRVAFYRKAIRWGTKAIEEHNASIRERSGMGPFAVESTHTSTVSIIQIRAACLISDFFSASGTSATAAAC
jgi:hypothetical protein